MKQKKKKQKKKKKKSGTNLMSLFTPIVKTCSVLGKLKELKSQRNIKVKNSPSISDYFIVSLAEQ